MDPKISTPNAEKPSDPGRPNSSSSRAIAEKMIDGVFADSVGLEVLPEEMKKWARSRIYEKLLSPRYSDDVESKYLRLRINELLTPISRLSEYLGFISHSATAKRILKKLLNEPCRARDIFANYESWGVDNSSTMRRWTYLFLESLVKYKFLDCRVVGDRESDNIPETTNRMPKLFYLEGRHTESTVEELVLQFVRRDAKQYPKKKTKKEPLSPKEKAEKKVIQKAYDNVAKSQFGESPLGRSLSNLNHTKKAQNSLKQKAKTLHVLRGDVDQAVFKEIHEPTRLLDGLSLGQRLLTSRPDETNICQFCGSQLTKDTKYSIKDIKMCRSCYRNKKHLGVKT